MVTDPTPALRHAPGGDEPQHAPRPTGDSDCYRPGGYLPDADKLTAAARRLFACCKHCTHDPDYDPNMHTLRCPEGCDDPVA